MPGEGPDTTRDGQDDRVLLLSTRELRALYADAAAQARLLGQLLRLAERVGRRRGGPVAVPVRVRRKGP